MTRAWNWRVATMGGAFLGYVAWNVWWASQGRVPPSIFVELTGLPCPTTGGTRSFLALLAGDLGSSLRLNPLTIPFILLLIVSAAQIVRHHLLSPWVGRSWLIALAVGWVIKLLSPPDTW